MWSGQKVNEFCTTQNSRTDDRRDTRLQRKEENKKTKYHICDLIGVADTSNLFLKDNITYEYEHSRSQRCEQTNEKKRRDMC